MTGRMIRVARPAMGSLFEIIVGGSDAEELERIAFAALDRVDWLESQLSHYLLDSEICRLNARACDAPVKVPPYLFALLARLREWSTESEGAFDCTKGRLVREWGFFRRGLTKGDTFSMPDQERIAEIVQQTGWKQVELNAEESTVRFLSPLVELHLGAVGKGFIVQCAADFLRESGIECALLHSGQSSIVAIGSPPDSAGWPIAISAPNEETRRLATVHLRDAALSTSGSAEQWLLLDTIPISHLFDPRNGKPLETTATVTVLTDDATQGDALSTASLVQGVDWTTSYCRTHPQSGALFIVAESAETPFFFILRQPIGRLAETSVCALEEV